MIDIFKEEIKSYLTGKKVKPLLLVTKILKKSTHGKPLNFPRKLNIHPSSEKFRQATKYHNAIIKNQQEQYQNKFNCPEDIFVNKLLMEYLSKSLSNFDKDNLANAAVCCPAHMAFAYSLYSKSGSKGLKRKAGEMNDTAMSYVFPYCGVVVTDKKHSNLFNRLKDTDKIPALKNTNILKYSEVFVDSDFKLKKALSKI